MGALLSCLRSLLRRGYMPAATSEGGAGRCGGSDLTATAGDEAAVAHATDLEMGSAAPTFAMRGGQTQPGGAVKAVDVKMSVGMSSPSVNAEEGALTGHGLALADVALPQDGGGAYWEWHVKAGCGGGGDADGPASDVARGVASIDGIDEEAGETTTTTTTGDAAHHAQKSQAMMFGVSTKRTPAFYAILAKSDGAASSLKLATKEMRSISTVTGDVVGVCYDSSGGDTTTTTAAASGKAKPTVQLRLNGALMEEYHLGLVRGKVYPSVWLPPPDGTGSAKLVSKEEELVHTSPAAKFVPLGVAAAGGEIV